MMYDRHARLITLVQDATVEDFEAWLASRAAESFLGSDPCYCPIAVWLGEKGAGDWSQEASVGDDFIHDGCELVAECPPWIAAFVRALDKQYGHGCIVPIDAVEKLFHTIKPTLEQLDA